MITAVVIVADWIASDVDRLPCLDPRPTADRVRHGWRDVGLLPAWSAQAGAPDTLFDRRFGAGGNAARPVQQEAVRVAQAMTRPQLVIIDAPMGEGKTEAALAAAETLATRFGCGGVVFALPTMATADAMVDRFTGWLSLAGKVVVIDEVHAADVHASGSRIPIGVRPPVRPRRGLHPGCKGPTPFPQGENCS